MCNIRGRGSAHLLVADVAGLVVEACGTRLRLRANSFRSLAKGKPPRRHNVVGQTPTVRSVLRSQSSNWAKVSVSDNSLVVGRAPKGVDGAPAAAKQRATDLL